jgi:hypothetical protein
MFPFFMSFFSFNENNETALYDINRGELITSCYAVPPSLTQFFYEMCVKQSRNTNYASSPLSSRHGSQESLRHLSSMSSMNMLQTPTGNRDIAGSQKKKGIKSSLGRFFSKKEKVS